MRLDPEHVHHQFRRPDWVTSWWRPEEGPYRSHYERELAALDQLLGDERPSRVLDVGTGQGRFARFFARRGARVVALDVNPAMLELARAAARREGLDRAIEFRAGTVEELGAAPHHPGERYNLISCMELLDHLPDPEGALNTFASLLSPGGTLAYTYCSSRSLQGTLFRLLQKIVPLPTLHCAQPFPPEGFDAALRRAGFEPGRQVGIGLATFIVRETFSRPLARALGWWAGLEGRCVPYVTHPALARWCGYQVGVALLRK